MSLVSSIVRRKRPLRVPEVAFNSCQTSAIDSHCAEGARRRGTVRRKRPPGKRAEGARRGIRILLGKCFNDVQKCKKNLGCLWRAASGAGLRPRPSATISHYLCNFWHPATPRVLQPCKCPPPSVQMPGTAKSASAIKRADNQPAPSAPLTNPTHDAEQG